MVHAACIMEPVGIERNRVKHYGAWSRLHAACSMLHGAWGTIEHAPCFMQHVIE